MPTSFRRQSSRVSATAFSCIRRNRPRAARHNFGFAAYQRWGRRVAKPKMRGSWDKEFSRAGARMYAGLESVFSDTHTFGKEGFAERDVFATFLDEATEILEQPVLREAGGAVSSERPSLARSGPAAAPRKRSRLGGGAQADVGEPAAFPGARGRGL